MLSADQIQAQCLRKYHDYLRSTLTAEAFFPLEIRFGRPSTTAQWGKLQQDITQLAQSNPGYQIEWQEINTRKWGRQRLPVRVWFQNQSDYLKAINKANEAACFHKNVQLALKDFPQIANWITSHISKIIEYASVWPQLLEVCIYFQQNQRPLRYARELPIRVGTKFIENHQSILRSLFDFLLSSQAIDSTSEHFETRFGLRYDEPLVRFRILDESLKEKLRLPGTDISLPHQQFCALKWKSGNIIIVENKMTFLTLPNIKNTIAIWGMGNAAALLEKVQWIGDFQLYYWGDLDVHGFHILARLRRAHPHAKSLLMDEGTLDTFKDYHQPAGDATYETTSYLSADERKIYERLQKEEILLEQEKIFPAFAHKHLSIVEQADRNYAMV